MWKFAIILWCILGGALMSIGIDGWPALFLALAIEVLIFVIIAKTGKPIMLMPEFSRPEIPCEGKLKDIDIEAEYKARQDKLREMREDDSVSDEDCERYFNARIRPFHPDGQYWNGHMWIDCRSGEKCPEWKLHPRMLNPLGQKFSYCEDIWYDYFKLERELRKMRRRDWWDSFIGWDKPIRPGR